MGADAEGPFKPPPLASPFPGAGGYQILAPPWELPELNSTYPRSFLVLGVG